MKIDLTKTIKDYGGKDFYPERVVNNELVRDEKAMTVRDAFAFCMNAMLTGEQQGSEEKARVFQLSLKLWGGRNGGLPKEVTFTPSELSFIKERAGKVTSPLVYGRICELIGEKP